MRQSGIPCRQTSKQTSSSSTYPPAGVVVPQPHLEHLGRQPLCLLFRVAWRHCGKHQDALANGRDELPVDRDGRRQHPLQDGYGMLSTRSPDAAVISAR